MSTTLSLLKHPTAISHSMVCYAILGGTGSTGGNLLQLLASKQDCQLHVYVRSRSKLEKMFPSIVKQSNVHIFEGSIDDVDLVRDCIAPSSTIFSVVASNTNTRNLSVAQDSAKILVKALSELHQKDSKAQLPRIQFLSSYSVKPDLKGNNAFASWLVHKALCNIYGDLMKAESFLREQKHEWLKVIFIQPGVLSSDPTQRGHSINASNTIKNQGFLGYVDLAAGMIEIAGLGDKYDWKGVVVEPITSANFDSQAPYNLAWGLVQYVRQSLY